MVGRDKPLILSEPEFPAFLAKVKALTGKTDEVSPVVSRQFSIPQPLQLVAPVSKP